MSSCAHSSFGQHFCPDSFSQLLGSYGGNEGG